MQCIQLNPILRNKYVHNSVVSRRNSPIPLSANKHKLIWLLIVLHKNIYIPMMEIALAKWEGDFCYLILNSSSDVCVNGVHVHFCTRSATGTGSASAKT